MTPRPDRIIDAHVHLWDPARSDWYPYLSGGLELDMGDTSGMARLFDVPTYLAESAKWNVEKIVNVAAAVGPNSIDETLDLDRRAEASGHPDAIVGGITQTETVAEAVAQLDRQMTASRFRGVRPMGTFEGPLPSIEVLQAVKDRDLVFDLMAHPHQLAEAAAGLEQVEDLAVVVEHAGWPRSNTQEEMALWKEGMEALASIGENVTCKLSGLAMPLESMSAAVLRPWLEYAIDTFGADRCMFASNFPVDGMHGTFDDLYEAFSEVTAGVDDVERDQLFAATAARIYRC